jgi:ketosteroid isomerase-like protein
MRRFRVILLVVSVSLACLLATELRGQQNGQALRALVPKIVASWESFDLAKIEPFYAQDADLTYFDLAPLKYNNWAEYRAGAQKFLFDPNTRIKLTVNNDLRVHSHGSFGWATFTFGAEITNKQGVTSHLDGRWTMLLEKRPKGWIVVHEHVSAPLGGS